MLAGACSGAVLSSARKVHQVASERIGAVQAGKSVKPSGHNLHSPQQPPARAVLAALHVSHPHPYKWKHILPDNARDKVARVWGRNGCSAEAMGDDVLWRRHWMSVEKTSVHTGILCRNFCRWTKVLIRSTWKDLGRFI